MILDRCPRTDVNRLHPWLADHRLASLTCGAGARDEHERS